MSDRDALILTVRDVDADYHGTGPLALSGREAALIADAILTEFLPVHDAETVRVTAEKAAQIAESEKVKWSRDYDEACEDVARRIRATFGLAPDKPKPDRYEFATTTGPRKAWVNEMDPPEGDGWEVDTSRGRDGWERFDYHEERYWRRLAPDEKGGA